MGLLADYLTHSITLQLYILRLNMLIWLSFDWLWSFPANVRYYFAQLTTYLGIINIPGDLKVKGRVRQWIKTRADREKKEEIKAVSQFYRSGQLWDGSSAANTRKERTFWTGQGNGCPKRFLTNRPFALSLEPPGVRFSSIAGATCPPRVSPFLFICSPSHWSVYSLQLQINEQMSCHKNRYALAHTGFTFSIILFQPQMHNGQSQIDAF